MEHDFVAGPQSLRVLEDRRREGGLGDRQETAALGSGHDQSELRPRAGHRPHATSENFAVIRQMGDGRMKAGIPDIGVGVVDVRDVAEADLRAASEPKARGRYIVSGHDSTLPLIARALLPRFEAYSLPRRVLPKWLVWAVGPLADKNTARRFVSRNVAWPWRADHGKSVRDLGMTYTPLEESVQTMFQQMIDSGQLPKLWQTRSLSERPSLYGGGSSWRGMERSTPANRRIASTFPPTDLCRGLDKGASLAAGTGVPWCICPEGPEK